MSFFEDLRPTTVSKTVHVSFLVPSEIHVKLSRGADNTDLANLASELQEVALSVKRKYADINHLAIRIPESWDREAMGTKICQWFEQKGYDVYWDTMLSDKQQFTGSCTLTPKSISPEKTLHETWIVAFLLTSAVTLALLFTLATNR